ncbi:hypothetical protein [Glutamicibacter sp. BW80]|uniref:hypothetical protein n=1 Tax=Glutamicibacter sp. BW80 TaxID=2024404 RepID=UPI001C3F0764|nr:hypothetical protein [Glutamicibacter sp. BW80]
MSFVHGYAQAGSSRAPVGAAVPSFYVGTAAAFIHWTRRPWRSPLAPCGGVPRAVDGVLPLTGG